ncbi:MAG TPA: 3-phosphoshikimate 1-carboxyvinyltransferase [Candidatus Nitrosotalea sp.]|nr:3-phosphoshikimate 1-carboxyvinyltransferase [Candidatus Nitrosotalea sp.]
MLARVRSPRRLRGSPRLPGDKSISHRALILGAVADGESVIEGLASGQDVLSTARCLQALGVQIKDGRVAGVGLGGLHPASGALDCGNSGTSMRLLAGLLAGQSFVSELVGDASLSRRPMARVVDPLLEMGAVASHPPLRVGGGGGLRGGEHRLAVASAQVKSALLLAGLYAHGDTVVIEPAPTRDHTELMLRAMGVELEIGPGRVRMTPPSSLHPLRIQIPGDLSAAAFWLVAAGIHPQSEIDLLGVGVNPTRSRLLDVLAALGADLGRENMRQVGSEAVADLRPRGRLAAPGLQLGADEVAALIDEMPILAVAATCLPGGSRISGAGELRNKESDRLRAMSLGLGAMGAAIEETPDGWVIEGGSGLHGARVDAMGDHRVAMALAIAALVAEGETEIDGAECVDISYPGFWEELDRLCS